eukprot:COSAG01_NODE_38764_length_485_cov_1.582902_1_plen_128_part_00
MYVYYTVYRTRLYDNSTTYPYSAIPLYIDTGSRVRYGTVLLVLLVRYRYRYGTVLCTAVPVPCTNVQPYRTTITVDLQRTSIWFLRSSIDLGTGTGTGTAVPYGCTSTVPSYLPYRTRFSTSTSSYE